MLGQPANQQAVTLLHKGIRVLSKMTAEGFPVDSPFVKASIAECNGLMLSIQQDAWKQEGGDAWKKKFGESASLGNAEQAKYIFYTHLGFTPSGGDDSDTLDKDDLADIDHPLADVVARYRKIDKCANTFLKSLVTECVDGRVHPFFSLARAKSYRSSSTDPNGQNFPVRDPETAAFVRQAIKAPPGYRIVECDYSGIEVVAAACYHKDPTMIKYLAEGYDMHRDMAAECYMIDDIEAYFKTPMGKKARYSSKNGFVFPEFYGSYWSQVAVSLWKNIARLDLRTTDLRPLSEHLKTKGIHGLGDIEMDDKGRPQRGAKGSFYRHIQEVEKNFWGKRFPIYDKWRKDWYSAYQKKGYFHSLTGFRYAGNFRRNQVINLPVQGSASHIKLQAAVNLDEKMMQRKMDSRLILEIHDSIIGLVKDSEFEDYKVLVQEEMVDRINETFKWLVVPVKIEIEASPSGGSWHEKKVVI